MKHLIFILLPALVVAQEPDTSWKHGGNIGVNFSQVGLRNWAGGGDNSLAIGSLLGLFANYKHDKIAWDNSLELGYGIVKLGKEPVRKADDKIILTSKFARSIVDAWAYSAMLDFRTQFAKGFDYGSTPKSFVSNFLSPAYVTLSLGAEYKPNDHFYALISPITGKGTIVRSKVLSDAGAYGVDKGKSFRPEFGWFAKSGYKRTIMEGVDFDTKLNLFSGYTDLGHVDVIWDNVLLMKVNKYVSSSVTVNVLYDNDIKDTDGKAKIQLKEVLAVGLLYTF